MKDKIASLVLKFGNQFGITAFADRDLRFDVNMDDSGPLVWYADIIDPSSDWLLRFCIIDLKEAKDGRGSGLHFDCSRSGELIPWLEVDMRLANDMLPICFGLLESAESQLGDKHAAVALVWQDPDESDFWFAQRGMYGGIALYHSAYSFPTAVD